ncbi:MAG TPA: GTPase [Roseiflexaceae bacterium]|nr:GTPase [Roseiflexaceae bacterium]
MQGFPGLTPDILSALEVPGINERWAAVQTRLHPALAALAELLRERAARRLPRAWPLYEITYRTLRYTNRGDGARAPLDEYHMAVDRPPRGAGVYVAVSAAERLVIVALQLQGRRKEDLRRVWEEQRPVWLPLIERLPEVRFTERRPRTEDRGPKVAALLGAATSAGGSPNHGDSPVRGPRSSIQETWLDRYLASRGSSYLLAGFAYEWGDERVARPDFGERLVEDVLALLPLNEAIMEQTEALDPAGAALLREQRARYSQLNIPPVETIVERVRARGLALPERLVRAYHVALRTKPLVILPGVSGTGKTRLTRLYADAVYDVAAGQENEHYLLTAVQPDWHNARDLLGYYNAISGRFHATPFLRFLMRANADPAMPYYACLDEMNLARPEYYLAPILSALETEDHLIDLGVPGPTVETVTGEVLQNPFRLPLNVAITGTVNVDESTHALSDKLLDRANVIELTDVDLRAFRASYRGAVDERAWQVIAEVHAIVARAGQPFGYRTLAEMLRYLEQARGVLPPEQALDQQVKQKVLPKLRGEDSPRLRRALTALLDLLLGKPQSAWGKAAHVAPEDLAAAPFPESAAKVRRMLERLDADGFTDFYG